MATESDPIREAVAEARRTQILEAAVQVFAEKGFHRATVRDVAQAAGVADGTIYNYFKNKKALLLAMITQFAEINQIAELVAQLGQVNDIETIIRAIVANRLELIARRRELIQALLPQLISDRELRQAFYGQLIQPMMGRVEQALQGQIEQGQIRPHDPRVVVHSLFGSVLGLILIDIVSEGRVLNDTPLYGQGLGTLLLHGLLPSGDDDSIGGA